MSESQEVSGYRNRARVGISLIDIAPPSRGLSMDMHDPAWPSCIPGEHMVPENLSAFNVERSGDVVPPSCHMQEPPLASDRVSFNRGKLQLNRHMARGWGMESELKGRRKRRGWQSLHGCGGDETGRTANSKKPRHRPSPTSAPIVFQ
ncbi:predicted protein [Chaetomium globosum CBS 148.51]|uniref:Uncharacterized protein n=1 Tax=Chaetomium globosum (strain ATCC 6205 / CBS 148.51 / DSM 1962 / NBRC 6347 / NRRL 1970) TaxID=306901 RepID=Q2GXU8_CHAGB|nr:uncharacterized protein CHGG_07206 [Chaetomium globosum CBS 148.51]EAQ85953.1 predicted protein [Chaetomium globosum CBS 148.51]